MTEQVLNCQGLHNHILFELHHLELPPPLHTSDKAQNSCHLHHGGTEQLLFPCVDAESPASSPPSPSYCELISMSSGEPSYVIGGPSHVSKPLASIVVIPRASLTFSPISDSVSPLQLNTIVSISSLFSAIMKHLVTTKICSYI